MLIYSDAGEQSYTGTQENCLSPSVKLLSSIPIDQQIFDKFDSSKMGLLSGKTFVSPFKCISKIMAASDGFQKKKKLMEFSIKLAGWVLDAPVFH